MQSPVGPVLNTKTTDPYNFRVRGICLHEDVIARRLTVCDSYNVIGARQTKFQGQRKSCELLPDRAKADEAPYDVALSKPKLSRSPTFYRPFRRTFPVRQLKSPGAPYYGKVGHNFTDGADLLRTPCLRTRSCLRHQVIVADYRRQLGLFYLPVPLQTVLALNDLRRRFTSQRCFR